VPSPTQVRPLAFMRAPSPLATPTAALPVFQPGGFLASPPRSAVGLICYAQRVADGAGSAPCCPPLRPPAGCLSKTAGRLGGLPCAGPTCSELLQQANRNAWRLNAFRAKTQSVERWMQSQGLPTRLRRRIKTFYAEVRVGGWRVGGGGGGGVGAVGGGGGGRAG
jgi:hypothetical protein